MRTHHVLHIITYAHYKELILKLERNLHAPPNSTCMCLVWNLPWNFLIARSFRAESKSAHLQYNFLIFLVFMKIITSKYRILNKRRGQRLHLISSNHIPCIPAFNRLDNETPCQFLSRNHWFLNIYCLTLIISY